jgi:hypothetical protein
MGKFKEENGKTRVGKFLKDFAPKILDGAGGLTGISFLNHVSDAIDKDKSISNELKRNAYDLILLDKQEVTKRWESDNKNGSKFAKNIRPSVLAFTNLVVFILCVLDSTKVITVKDNWIDLYVTTLTLVNTAYFGLRSWDKRNNK